MKKVSKNNRPGASNFIFGSFVEDYEFKNSGDLDEHNGRFAVTPEYPNGIYHYHATISEVNDSSVLFNVSLEDQYSHTLLETLLNLK